MGANNFLQALGWAVLNSLWQMALLWVLFQLITGIFSKNIFRSSAKSSLASLLLIAGFGWFIYTFISIYYSETADATILNFILVNTNGNELLNSWLQQTLPAASLLYLVLLVLPLLHFIRNYRYVQIIRNHGLTKANVQWRIFIQKVAAHMGINKPVHIWASELVSSPVTIGFLKPLILIPMAAMNNLTPKQIEAVLLHELSHIKRHDYLVNLIINFIQTILYFNPFVKAFVKAVEREREKSCDEMVIQFQYDSHEYATALLILEKNHYASKTLTVAASGKKHDLLHRIELILGIQHKPILSFNKLAGLMAALFCVIALNALLIISKPSDEKKNITYNNISSPLYFFTTDNEAEQIPSVISNNKELNDEIKAAPIINNSRLNQILSKTKTISVPEMTTVDLNAYTSASDFLNVKYAPPVEMPELKNYQVVQVKEAMDASKKVLENAQWKNIEKNIAEVLTQNEKELVKLNYQKAISKIDWNKMENKLRSAYDHIDWDQVNEQLEKAVTLIRIDSLQKNYSEIAINLDLLQKEISATELNGIPDTDITVKDIEQRKNEVRKILNVLKAQKDKKIIHL